MNKKRLFSSCVIFFVLPLLSVSGQTTAFTYQGNLFLGGVPANGNYDFQFVLFSVPTGGSSIGLGLGLNNVPVTNGSFSVILSFPNQFTGSDRFLEIRVRPAGQGTHTTLAPRQPILSTPYAINAALLGGTAADQFVITTDPRLTDSRNPLPNSGSYIQNRATLQAGTNFNISGTGTVGSLTARESSFFEKGISVGTTLDVGSAATIGSSLTVGSTANVGSLTVVTTASVGSLGVGSTATVGSLSVGSTANVSGAVNTNAQYRIGGNPVLTRSRLDLFNTLAVPRGYSFEVLNSPSFMVLRNDLGTTIMTIAPDGKVGIGTNNPNEATLEIGGTLAVSNLGGSDGEHLCRDGNLIRACSVANSSSTTESRAATIIALEAKIQEQHDEIARQRKELAAIKKFICAQDSGAEICRQ